MQLHSHEVAKKESAVLTHRPVFHFVVLRQDLTMKFELCQTLPFANRGFPGAQITGVGHCVLSYFMLPLAEMLL